MTAPARRVRTWAEFRQEWDKVTTQAAEEVLHAMVDEEAKANARMAHLTGICPKCGDGGWWIDDQGRHLCDCPEGLRQAAEALKDART